MKIPITALLSVALSVSFANLDEIVTQVIHLQRADARWISRVLAPLVSHVQGSSLSADRVTTCNSITVTDTARNVARIKAVIKDLDGDPKTPVVRMEFNFKNADVSEIIKSYAKAAKVTVVYCPSEVHGQVNIVSEHAVEIGEALEILKSVLRVRGLVMEHSPSDRVLSVVPKAARWVYPDDHAADGSAVQQGSSAHLSIG